MSHGNAWLGATATAVLAFGLVWSQSGPSAGPSAGATPSPHATLPSLQFDQTFWQHWGDGQAELAGYDLTFNRYGQTRKGVAVTIYVTETFSNRLRVKADPGRHPKSDTFPVMKLNLAKDFPTGIYDYNLMLSAFSALTPVNGRPAGSLTKVSFGSQEWCGQVYHQLLFDKDRVRQQSNSYFDGEADRADPIASKPNGVSEDGLFLWARGFAVPDLAPGEKKTVPLLISTQRARLGHVPLSWRSAVLSRASGTTSVTVPAGTFTVERFTAQIDDGRTYALDVEQKAPRRLVAWSVTDRAKRVLEQARLLKAKRMKYWQLSGNGKERLLHEIGLKPRAPRTP